MVITLEALKTPPLVPAGLLAEASVTHQALLVHLLQVDWVLLAVFVMAVILEASTGVAASGAPTEEVMEEVMEEATGKLKE